MSYDKRHALPENHNLIITDENTGNAFSLTIEKEIGRGGSCIVYKGCQKDRVGNEPVIRSVIVKEFFPKALDEEITRSDTMDLTIPQGTQDRFDERLDLFCSGQAKHIIYANENADYVAGGSTALLDAISFTMNKLIGVQKNTSKEYRADKIMFVIITDGEENSSREYSADKIRSMIKHEKEKYGWEFIFLGANIDAIQTAQHFGIDADCAVDYVPDARGTQLNFEAMAETVACYRTYGIIPNGPMEAIRKDMRKRGIRK